MKCNKDISEKSTKVTNQSTITGFIHNVSPVKKSNRTSYFDINIQTEKEVLRGVCFSMPKHKQFKLFSTTNDAVILTNFTINNSNPAFAPIKSCKTSAT